MLMLKHLMLPCRKQQVLSTFITYMSKTLFSRTQKINSRRYSQQELRPNRTDHLLITQLSQLSQPLFPHPHPHPLLNSLRSRLPIITHNPTLNSTLSASHSHARLDKLSGNVGELEDSIRILKEDVDQIKQQFANQGKILEDKLQKTQQALGSKVTRLAEMVRYWVQQAGGRTQRLNLGCHSLKASQVELGERMRRLKQRLRVVQNEMGVYTGEDKYIA